MRRRKRRLITVFWSKLMKKNYKIADFIVEMDTFGITESQAESYICTDKSVIPDIIISPDRETVRNMFPHLSDDGVEYNATGMDFHRKIIRKRAVMLHSSSVAFENRAYMFSASCGTGKSTHTGLWRQVFGDENVKILNDDKPVVRQIGNTWYAYGTPWCGKAFINTNLRVPIGGICMLSRGEKNRIARCSNKEAIQLLLMQTIKPNNITDRMMILEMLDSLIRNVPIWKMECNMDPEAARISYEAMSGARRSIFEQDKE